MGPSVQELAEALRRTAKLVEEGSIMPKVLDRRRADFVASMETVDLGDSPEEVVRIVVALGRDGMLDKEELGRVRDALARRLRG